jgi:hypothetical protein
MEKQGKITYITKESGFRNLKQRVETLSALGNEAEAVVRTLGKS